MTTDFYGSLAIQLLPFMIMASVAIYKVLIQYLPANRQAQLANVTSILSTIATTVVASIEQTMPDQPHEEKLAQAANDVLSHLDMHSIKVPPEMVSSAIESAVYALNQAQTASNTTIVPQDVASFSTKKIAALNAIINNPVQH